jgi:hypothetical protein
MGVVKIVYANYTKDENYSNGRRTPTSATRVLSYFHANF